MTGRCQETGFGRGGNAPFLDVVYSGRDNALNYTFVVFKHCGRSHTSVKKFISSVQNMGML